MKAMWLCLGWFLSTSTLAQTSLGPVYPITEVDLLALIKQHAHEEQAVWEGKQRELEARLKRHADTPRGTVLPRAKQTKRWKYEVKGADGIIAAQQERHWLFIDATDPEQMRFAQRFMSDRTVATHRVVLTNGSIEQTQKALDTRVWFDQAARLIERLEIRALPAYVKFTQRAIFVSEVKL